MHGYERMRRTVSLCLIILMVMALGACEELPIEDGQGNDTQIKEESALENSSGKESVKDKSIGEGASQKNRPLTVHFLDVGQGDSILIQTPAGENVLVDAGGNDDEDTVVKYLVDQGIEILDVLVGTHPHEDHIGGLDAVIDSFEIGEIYMPKVTHTTKTFEDVLEAIRNKGLKIKAAVAGMNLPLEGLNADILAPVEDMESNELNDYSVVIRMQWGDAVFLFQGDAERRTEEEILASGVTITADVIKVGHHGSSSSSHKEYIEAVDPSCAVIMLGKDNKYGHPHEETMKTLAEEGIKVYRTDECGTIVAVSDGEQITFSVEPGSYSY